MESLKNDLLVAIRNDLPLKHIETIIEKLGDEIFTFENTRDKHPLLLLPKSRNSHKHEILELLLNKGFSVDTYEQTSGSCILRLFVHYGLVECVELLITRGADTYFRDFNGNKIWQQTNYTRMETTIRKMRDQEFDTLARSIACKMSPSTIEQFLNSMEKLNDNQLSRLLLTASIHLENEHRDEVVEMIIKKGATFKKCEYLINHYLQRTDITFEKLKYFESKGIAFDYNKLNCSSTCFRMIILDLQKRMENSTQNISNSELNPTLNKEQFTRVESNSQIVQDSIFN